MILYIIVKQILKKTRVINVWPLWTYSVTDTACNEDTLQHLHDKNFVCVRAMALGVR